mmetsp:Transcript_65293/g.143126  ORF Transcript_65293/g.143126 Transcript_65293/m.143126 type:complete len:269 (-) Transcript_65293:51-857(-)
MLRRAISACCCYAVRAQDAECQSSGTICCALKYDGARNFFNQQDLRCEAPADDCGPSQEYDAQVNKCIDVTNALSSVTDAPSTAPSSTGSTAAACSTCCGEHGTPDSSDPSDKELCVCDVGWTSSAVLGPCSVQVAEATTSVSPGTSTERPTSSSFGLTLTFASLSNLLLGNGPFVLLLAILACCVCCCLCRCWIRNFGCRSCCCCYFCWESPGRKYARQVPPPILWEEGAARAVMPPLPPPISSPLVLDKTGRTSRMVGKMQPPGCH